MRLKLPVSRRIHALTIGTNPVGWKEVLVSTLCASMGILLVYAVSVWLLEGLAVLFVAASMGSSAVLLFAVPHASMAQPWPLFGGHLLSALTGVTCTLLIPQPALAAALAVGLSIGIMQLFRCVHAPGGATALAAALGGGSVYGMGYLFVLTPIMLNVFILFTAAVLANYPFAWRRYPIGLMKNRSTQPSSRPALREEDISHAIDQMNVIVDVTAEELREIAERALRHAQDVPAHGVTLPLGPRFVRAGNSKATHDRGWVVHKTLTPEFDGHRAVQTVTFKLVPPPARKSEESSP